MSKGLVFGGLNGKAGGVTFAGNPNWYGGATAAASPTERLSVTGEGWIISVTSHENNTRYIKLQIDGVQVVPATNDLNLPPMRTIILLLPFKTRFKLFDNNQTSSVFYVLGNDFGSAIPNAFTQANSATAQSLRQTVTGKGWVTGIYGYGSVKLEIDGTQVIPSSNNSTAGLTQEFPTMYRFNTEAKLYGGTSAGMSYILE